MNTMDDLVRYIHDNQGAIFLGSGVLLISLLVINRLRHRNRKTPPGLPSIPLLGSIPWLPRQADNLHLTVTEFAKKYGKIYTLDLGRQRHVVLNDHSTINNALVKQGTIFADRPNLLIFKNTNPDQKGLGFAHFNETFIRNKQISLSILRDLGLRKNVMQSRILSEVSELLEALAKQEAEPFDPSEVLNMSVSNVICSVLFSKRFRHDDTRFCNAVYALHDWLNRMGRLFLAHLPLICYLPWARRQIQPTVQAYVRVVEFIQEELLEHSETCNPSDHERDFIAAYKHRMGGDLDPEALTCIAFDFFLAGTDTTSIAIRWALLYMANNPDIQSRVHQEIDDVLGQGRTPSMSDRMSLKLTEAVLLETFRISPPTPLAIPHSMTSDTELNGWFLEKGTRVYVNIWAAHHDPDVWPDPDRFDPGRFLDDQGQVTGRDRIIPFSLGRRSCLGEALAQQELFLYFTSILQRFQVLPPPGQDKLSERGVCGSTVLTPTPYKIVLKII